MYFKLHVFITSVLIHVVYSNDLTPLNSFSAEFINEINAKAETWQAGQNFPFKMTRRDLSSVIDLSESKIQRKNYHKVVRSKSNVVENIPESFDAREQWPHCNIGKIFDQGPCTSSYAFSVAPAFSNRRCILNGGQGSQPMSIEYLLSCCHACKYDDDTRKCGAGVPIAAWWFLHKRGIISGGDYNSSEGCQPLSLKPCEKRLANQDGYYCDGVSPPELRCHTRCTNEDYEVPYSQDRHRAKFQYYVSSEVSAIQNEIMTNGPTSVEMALYEDFFHYKSGVYQHTKGERHFHKHSAKLIGWGVENNLPYWLLINSWGENWGDRGTFKILRGTRECNMEYYVTAGIPKK